MKRNWLVALILCLIATTALAANTTHYNIAIPTVGGSQNTWGTTLNNALGSFDTQVWNASGGTTIGINSTTTGGNVALTNPINNVVSLGMTTTGKKLALPPMNATASPVPGGTIWVTNSGSNAYSIVAADNSTSVLSSLGAGQSVALQPLTNSTTNGTFQVYGPFLTSSGTLALGSLVTAASPAVSGDATTGFYTSGAAKVDVTVSGVNRSEWGTTGQNINGALTFTSTAAAATGQTGVHSTTANALSLMTTGTDRVVVANDGGVTIGSPTGGSKGSGTLNIAGAGYYVNGTLIGDTISVQTFSGNGTYTPTAGMRYAIIEMISGGGGGGGTTASAASAGGGGGSGGYARVLVTAAQVGASKAVVVGAAGAAGSSSGGTGGTGGTTSVANLVSSTGGAGGVGGSGSDGGGLGGVVTLTAGTALYTLNGQRGNDGAIATGFQLSGQGGGSLFGPGGFANLSTSAFVGGGSGNGNGSGGAGASGNSATGVAGGAGSAGIVIITEFQ